MASLDESRAYVLHEDWALKGALRLALAEPDISPRELIRGDLRPGRRIAFRLAEEGLLFDVVFTTDLGLVVVSPKFVDVMSANKLTGWNTYPIHVEGAASGSLQGYVGLSITGQCGAIDESRSKRVTLRNSPDLPAFPYRLGLYVKDDSWDGSDFFNPAQSTFVCAVESVSAAIHEHGIMGCELERMSEITELVWDE